MDTTTNTETRALPPCIDAQCSAGRRPQLSVTRLGLIVHPEEYDPSALTEDDLLHDCAVRRLTQSESITIVEYDAAGVTMELESPVGPRVLYPATILPEEIEPLLPSGWAVDYDTPHVHAGYDSDRDCPRYSAPLMPDSPDGLRTTS